VSLLETVYGGLSSGIVRDMNKAHIWIVSFTFGCVLATWLIHNIAVNPHTDMQLVTYTMQMLRSISDGDIWEYLMTPRKYPVFPSIILGILYSGIGGVLLMTGIVSSFSEIGSYFISNREAVYLLSRLVIVICSIGSVVLVHRISSRMHGDAMYGRSASILLFSSVIFPVFSTAIRPHMIVTFFTLLAIHTSGFIPAALAFCSLQNGLLAFIFPVFSSVRRPLRVIIFGGISMVFSILFGYIFMVRTMFDGLTFGALGNTYFDGGGLTGGGISTFLMLMIGSEIFITIFSFIAIFILIKKRTYLKRNTLVPVFIYLALYIFFFGLQDGTVMRFFFPIIPILAIVGAPAINALPRFLHDVFVIVVVMMHVKFVFLGLQPDTYQLAHDFLNRYPDARISTDLPWYFLNIPETSSVKSYKDADLIVTRLGEEPDDLNGFERCARFGFTPASRDGLLWSDSDRDWMILRLWQLRNAGPTIQIYCKTDILENS
jgi:hypothetical protein